MVLSGAQHDLSETSKIEKAAVREVLLLPSVFLVLTFLGVISQASGPSGYTVSHGSLNLLKKKKKKGRQSW